MKTPRYEYIGRVSQFRAKGLSRSVSHRDNGAIEKRSWLDNSCAAGNETSVEEICPIPDYAADIEGTNAPSTFVDVRAVFFMVNRMFALKLLAIKLHVSSLRNFSSLRGRHSKCKSIKIKIRYVPIYCLWMDETLYFSSHKVSLSGLFDQK